MNSSNKYIVLLNVLKFIFLLKRFDNTSSNSSSGPTTLCRQNKGMEFLQQSFPRLHKILYGSHSVFDSTTSSSSELSSYSNDDVQMGIQTINDVPSNDIEKDRVPRCIVPKKLVQSINCKRDSKYFVVLVQQGYECFRNVDEL